MSRPSVLTLGPRTQPRYGAVTLYSRRRRRRHRRRAIVVVTVLVAAGIAAVAVRQYRHDDRRRHYIATDGWPHTGQAAYRLGGDGPQFSPGQRSAPIASLAKVMTAYLVLRDHPLDQGAEGLRLTVTGADVADTRERRDEDQSVVSLRRGEELTERQALMAVLLPSANNVAVMLARASAGSIDGFVARMNSTAVGLGMFHTHYTDPSGFDEGTRSTAGDQLALARVAARNPMLADMVATPSYHLPVAGTVHNTDTLLGTDGFVGTKTGSDDAAGGCFMFRTRRTVDGKSVDMIGVVLGQHGDNLITAGLYAAKQLADKTAPAHG